jgi:hypothetical protein
MHRYIDVSRAARLAGVSRAEIQRLVADSSLATFEGKIEYAALVNVFPEIKDSRSSMVEIVSQIKEDAVRKKTNSQGGGGKPSMATLQHQVDDLRKDLDYYRQRADDYRSILLELRPKLESLQQKSEHKQHIQTIINWFVHKTRGLW